MDDFLSRPRARSSSPVTSKPMKAKKVRSKTKSKKRSPSREPSPSPTNTNSTAKKKPKFIPKSVISAPSPKDVDEGEDVNELDTRPDDKIFTGEIIDWKGKFGFFKCDDIAGKIFVHSKDVKEGRTGIKIGSQAEFQVLHRDSSVVGAKAVNVRMMQTPVENESDTENSDE